MNNDTNEDLQNGASAALDVFSEILGWINFVTTQTCEYFKSRTDNMPIDNPSASSSNAFIAPSFFTWLVAPKNYKWEKTRGEDIKIPDKFYFFIVSLRRKNKWKLEIGFGKCFEVRRNVGVFGPRTIAREMLDLINEERKNSGYLKTSHAEGSCEVEWRDFFKYDNREKVGELSQDVSKKFLEWLGENTT